MVKNWYYVILVFQTLVSDSDMVARQWFHYSDPVCVLDVVHDFLQSFFRNSSSVGECLIPLQLEVYRAPMSQYRYLDRVMCEFQPDVLFYCVYGFRMERFDLDFLKASALSLSGALAPDKETPFSESSVYEYMV